jgi:hypothetical protein
LLELVVVVGLALELVLGPAAAIPAVPKLTAAASAATRTPRFTLFSSMSASFLSGSR